MTYLLPYTRYNFIDFQEIIDITKNDLYTKINELQDDDFSIKDKTHKQYFYHYFILNLCEILKKYNSVNTPVIYYTGKEEELFVKNLIRFNTYIPFLLVKNNISLEDFKNTIKPKFGEYKELVSNLDLQVVKNNKKKISYHKIKYFVDKYKLTYLTKEYFNNIKNIISLV